MVKFGLFDDIHMFRSPFSCSSSRQVKSVAGGVGSPGQACWSLTFQQLFNDQQSRDPNFQLLLLHAAECLIHVIIKWDTAIGKNSHTACALSTKKQLLSKHNNDVL